MVTAPLRSRSIAARLLSFAFPVVFGGCGADPEAEPPPLFVEGTIEEWALGECKRVVARTCSGTETCYEIGSGAVSSSGSFELTLANPHTSEAWSSLCTAEVIQPANVKYASVGWTLREGDTMMGEVQFASARTQGVEPGNRYGFFRWVDQDSNANGAADCDEATWHYGNVHLTKGWNPLTTDAVSARERHVSASHPDELSWHLFALGLGYACDSGCDGTTCARGGPGYDRVCPDSDLELPCMGTATGMYCSKSCTEDADCANENEPMRCLTSCSTFPGNAGKCWKEGDFAFLSEQVCP